MSGSSLIQSLEAAEGGSRELDYAIKAWLEPHDEYWALRVAADWTASLDAALALAERVLDQRGPININICLAGSAQVVIDSVGPCDPVIAQSVARTPALAFCIAILRAKEGGQ
ncbi:hypothetical protein [Brevundimonas sp.]|uniref:hypothetical protein n=1 Tax=Brevundimonas sp. TaxID=1871086 RepID=UPI0025BB9EE3|nr:hypothetical protein [Brevundimonas sp.]